jgi:Protein of unknwon function (DUF3008)
MPSRSKSQQKLFGAALGAKRGAKTFPAAKKLAGQMSEQQLKDFATGPVKPTKPAKPQKTKSYYGG